MSKLRINWREHEHVWTFQPVLLDIIIIVVLKKKVFWPQNHTNKIFNVSRRCCVIGMNMTDECLCRFSVIQVINLTLLQYHWQTSPGSATQVQYVKGRKPTLNNRVCESENTLCKLKICTLADLDTQSKFNSYRILLKRVRCAANPLLNW